MEELVQMPSLQSYLSLPTMNAYSVIMTTTAIVVFAVFIKTSYGVTTMYRVLRNSRIPMFLHRKSNHVFTVWQHLVLLTIRQYQGKSYRMYVDWLVETH